MTNDPTLEEKRDMEIKELQARCRWLEEENKRKDLEKEIARLLGRIEGLEFSIRCNGISGKYVRSDI